VFYLCRTGLLLFLVLTASCGSQPPLSRSSQIGDEIRPVVAGGGIGDDVCAVMVRVDAAVVDTQLKPVANAEVWDLSDPQPEWPDGRARRLGTTDKAGRLAKLICPIGGADFSTWNPQTKPLSIRLMIVREGYGVQKVSFAPDVQDLLKQGKVLGVPYS
jgi:hypothetical protein